MYIEVEFYTTDHVIQGSVDTPQERLSDFLNWKNETTVLIKDARINRLLSLGKTAPLQMMDARLEKSAILWARPVERDMTAKSIYRRATRLTFPITVLLPNYELNGQVYLTEKIEIKRVLLSRPEDFIALTQASAIYSLYPAVKVENSTIIFNKNRMLLVGGSTQAGNFFEPVTTPQPDQK